MKRQRNVNLLLMEVGGRRQMAQTIYIPAIADMAQALNVREGAVQRTAAYLPDLRRLATVLRPTFRPGWAPPRNPRRHAPFCVATLIAMTTHSLTVLISPPAPCKGWGTALAE